MMLPAFSVRLTRDTTESCDVIVHAENADKAVEIALDKAGKYGENLDDWELDDGNCHEVYIGDNNNAVEPIKGPTCLFKNKGRPAIEYPMYWNKHAYTGGQSGSWHGHWLVHGMDDKFAEEVINYRMIEGKDYHGKVKSIAHNFSWRIHGDPTQPPEE